MALAMGCRGVTVFSVCPLEKLIDLCNWCILLGLHPLCETRRCVFSACLSWVCVCLSQAPVAAVSPASPVWLNDGPGVLPVKEQRGWRQFGVSLTGRDNHVRWRWGVLMYRIRPWCVRARWKVTLLQWWRIWARLRLIWSRLWFIEFDRTRVGERECRREKWSPVLEQGAVKLNMSRPNDAQVRWCSLAMLFR